MVKLNAVLLTHIRATLPDIKLRIAKLLEQYRSELGALGDLYDAGNNQNTILAIITEFSNAFRSVLEGKSLELSTSELNGMARINYIFHEIFAGTIRDMDPFDQIKDNDIRTLLYNSTGPSPSLFGGLKVNEKRRLMGMPELDIIAVKVLIASEDSEGQLKGSETAGPASQHHGQQEIHKASQHQRTHQQKQTDHSISCLADKISSTQIRQWLAQKTNSNPVH